MMWTRKGNESKYFSNCDSFGSSNPPPLPDTHFLDYICLDDLEGDQFGPDGFPWLLDEPISTPTMTLHSLSPKRSNGSEPVLVGGGGDGLSEQLAEAECAGGDDVPSRGRGSDSSREKLTAIITTHHVAEKIKKRKPLSPGKRRTTHQMIRVEDLKKLFSKTRTEAAKSLKGIISPGDYAISVSVSNFNLIGAVSVPTLKRVSRKYGIPRWPFDKKKNMSANEGLLGKITHVSVEPKTEQLSPKQISTVIVAKQDERTMIVKVKYGDDFVKFEISFASKLADLEDEISKRLKLKVGSFDIKYMDDEQDWILIRKDEDLWLCMKSVGTTTIKMLVLPCSN